MVKGWGTRPKCEPPTPVQLEAASSREGLGAQILVQLRPPQVVKGWSPGSLPRAILSGLRIKVVEEVGLSCCTVLSPFLAPTRSYSIKTLQLPSGRDLYPFVMEQKMLHKHRTCVNWRPGHSTNSARSASSDAGGFLPQLSLPGPCGCPELSKAVWKGPHCEASAHGI